jgi:DNA-binding HxlR family transcriptional regulator
MRFCELQEQLGGVNPSTLSSRLKMLEEEGLVRRNQNPGNPAPCGVQPDRDGV